MANVVLSVRFLTNCRCDLASSSLGRDRFCPVTPRIQEMWVRLVAQDSLTLSEDRLFQQYPYEAVCGSFVLSGRRMRRGIRGTSPHVYTRSCSRAPRCNAAPLSHRKYARLTESLARHGCPRSTRPRSRARRSRFPRIFSRVRECSSAVTSFLRRAYSLMSSS